MFTNRPLTQASGRAARPWLGAVLAVLVVVVGATPASADGGGQAADPVTVNSAPLATGDAYFTSESSLLVVPGPAVLANDYDPDGDPLTAELTSNPTHGTVTLDSGGGFIYFPFPGYHGPDSFAYRASDGLLFSASATVSLTVTSVNSNPAAAPDSFTSDNGTVVVAAPGVLANDTDADGDALTAALVSAPKHGSLQLNPDGSFTYTADAGYYGPDTFVYRAQDPEAGLSLASVTLNTTAPNSAPVATDDAYTTLEDQPLSVIAPGVLANDTDPDGDALTAVLETGPAHGSLTLAADGSFLYLPAANVNGTDSFTYRAKDAKGVLSDPATVSLTVTAQNDPPQGQPDRYTTAEDTPLTVAAPGVLANDSDVDGDVLTASVASRPQHGMLTLNTDGSFTYVPARDYSGSDFFNYTYSDGHGGSGTAVVTITVTEANDAPTVTVASGGSCGLDDRSGTVNLNVADVDNPASGLTLTASSSNTALVPNSQVTFGSSGASRTMSVATLPGRTGTAVVTVTVSDGTSTSTVPVTVKAAGNGADTVVGTDGADILLGQNGNDMLSGLGGNDLLCGGSGNDILSGGGGDDVLSGGSGSDQLTGGPGADRFSGGTGTDVATDLRAAEGDTQDGSVP